MTLIVDSGALYATLDRDDQDHAACLHLLSGTREQIVIPAPVLVEVDYWIGQRLSPVVLIKLLADTESGLLKIEDLIPQDYRRVSEICAQYSDSYIGFVDVAVLAIVERLNEPKLATIDHRHFRMLRPRHVAALELLPA